MKISELITQLEALKENHGDGPVYINDADTNWSLKVEDVEFHEHLSDKMHAGVHIQGYYE